MSYQPIAPPAPLPSASLPQTKIKPSKAWYWIGGLLIAAGIAAAITLIVVWLVKTSDTVDKFARVKVPPAGADAELQFNKAGTYTIYYEYRSKVDGEKIENSSHEPPSQLNVAITGQDGKQLATRPEQDDITFSFNDKVGRAVLKVDIPAPGSYALHVTSNATEAFTIAVGKGIIRTVIPYAIAAGGAFLLGLALGLTAIIMTAVKRGRRKRERRAAEQGAFGGYGAPSAPPAPYPGAYAPPPPAWTPPSWDAPPAPAPGPGPAPAPAPPTPVGSPPSPAEPPWGPPTA